MTYKEIEEKYQQLDNFINELEETFEKINAIGVRLASRAVNSPDDCREVLQELAGLYIYLSPILTVAEMGERICKEQAFDSYREKCASSGEKVVAAVADRESTLASLPNKNVYNKILSYVNACRLAIGVGQSLLKRIEEERDLINTAE